MQPSKLSRILTINGGSSSIRFALFEGVEPMARAFEGKVERIGLPGTSLTISRGPNHQEIGVPEGNKQAVDHLLALLVNQPEFIGVGGVGHRVVHGMAHSTPARITSELIEELHRNIPYDPDHLPLEIELIQAFAERHPKLAQVACFDTAFHRTMPRVAKLLPIPRRYDAKGVQRYGFHGLSYAFLMEELDRLGDPAAKNGRVILAHLGNGASMAAVLHGQSIETTMGFTPTAGLVMSTRSGDLDPGLIGYLGKTEQVTPAQFGKMVNHESGLLGVSQISSDMRDLLSRREDVKAKEAVDLFCYHSKKWIGSLAAALGGLDTLVFAGGIGENSPEVRKSICQGLGFLGIDIHSTRNARNASLISKKSAPVVVRVIRTDEEVMIARSVLRVLGLGNPKEKDDQRS